MNKTIFAFAFLAIVMGTVVCPFLPHPSDMSNPLHAHLMLFAGNGLHADCPDMPLPASASGQRDNSADQGKDGAGQAMIHNYDSLAAAGSTVVSGSFMAPSVSLVSFSPGYDSLSARAEPRGIQPQEFVSLKDRPPTPSSV